MNNSDTMHRATPDNDAVTHCICGKPLEPPIHYKFPYNGGAKASIATPETDKQISNEYEAKEYLVHNGFTLEQAQAVVIAINIMQKGT